MNLFRFCYNGPVSLADAQGLLCDSLWRSLGNAAGSMFTGDTQADPNSYIAQRTAELGPTENIVPGIVSDAVTAAGSAATAAAAAYLGGRLADMAAEALGLDDLLASALGEAEGGDAGAGVGEDLGAGDACSAAEETAVGESAIPKGGPCFAAGTKVSTPAGEEDIENIKAGDTVYAYDFGEGKVVEEPVEAIHQNFTYHWVEIEVNGEVIRATRSHPFWVESEKRWYRAADLKVGMKLLSQSGQTVAVSSLKIDDPDQAETTYNFEVAYQHDYFVGFDGVLVHNGPSFVVSPNGTVFPVPTGAVGPSPVINPAGNQTGVAFTGGSGGANGNVNTLRIMNPTAPRGASPGYPNGYAVYENGVGKGAQAVDPYTGQTLPRSQAHFPCD